jgi:putative peptide zinc metalloprotease protein
VVFNGNPLLRYDGYYILVDLIEIPNLRTRLNAYLGYLCERYLFGHRDAETPNASRGERAWFVSYGVLSFFYRILVMVASLLYLADLLFSLGLLLVALGALVWGTIPVFKGLKFLFTNPRIRSVRTRAITVSAALVVFVLGVISLVPLPYRTSAEGVIWLPEDSFVRAGADGFVERIVARPGTKVQTGDLLVVLADRERVLGDRVRELEARYVQYQFTEPVKADLVQEELRYETERLKRTQQQTADLIIRSRVNGTFVVPVADDLPGRFVRQGELLGHVLELGAVTVRAIVSQDNIDLVQHRTRAVEVRLSEKLAETVPAVVRRITPGASERLPAKALGTVGGGEVVADPTDRQGLTAIEKVFQLELELPSHTRFVNLGGRGYIRFDHGWSPLAVQWYRSVRQLFLSRFNV